MTTPLFNPAVGTTPIATAIKAASKATGVGADFLTHMAKRESGFDPNAKAKTSSAAGLFQFIEQTWLGAVKSYGARHGLGGFAADITRGADGRLQVADAARRDEILNLRFDADKAARLAGELANENKSYLERALGRAAGAADLYTAHFLGPAGAVKLLSAAGEARAADLLPNAAAANKPVFYDGARARTVSEVIANIAKSFAGTADTGETPLAALTPSNGGKANDLAKNAGYRPVSVEAAAARTAIPIASFGTIPTESIAIGPAQFSTLALAALFALDPTSLIRGEGDDPKTDRF